MSSNNAPNSGASVANRPEELSQWAEEFIATRTREAQEWFDSTTSQTGETLQAIAANPFLRFLNETVGIDWFMAILGEVDLEKVETTVREIQKTYPQERPSEIAHRLLVQQAWEAGKVGFIANIIPPIAAILMGIELAAITRLQAELVYQIAAAYGLDLRSPSRRGEVLAIYGLSFSGNLLKSGLNVIELIPGVGAVVGASSNAAILYALGYTADRFYDAKQNTTFEQATSEAFRDRSAEVWESALEQSAVMDRILAHMILASYPERKWSDILPTLQRVSPDSVDTIATHLENPEALDILLDRLSPELATILLSRCYRIARSNGVFNQQEKEIIAAIEDKFDIRLGDFEGSIPDKVEGDRAA